MRRLLDDPQLPAALRHDMQQARVAAQRYPTSDMLPPLRAALENSSRGPDVAGRDATRFSQLWGSGWKLLLVMAVAGSAAFGIQRWLTSEGGAEARPVPTPPLAAVDPVQVAQAEVVANAEVEPTPAAVSSSQRPRAVRPAKAPSADSSTRREIAQLVRIRELLKRDPAAALELAERSEREFPAGLLSAERQALAILALAKTGATDDARRKANAFFLRYPQSPMREQLEAALAR